MSPTTRRRRRHADGLEPLRAELAAVDRRLRRAVRHQPLASVAAALTAGFVLGRLLRGWT